MNKRNKLNASGAYSSPTQAIDEEGELQRPPGRNTSKDTKDKHKSSSKSKCSGSLTSESVDKFNEIQLRKSIAAEKMADATLIQAEATKVQAEAEKERVETEKEKIKVDKLNKYLDLLHKDTSACWEVLIACTGHGEIGQWLGRECSLVVIMEFPQSCSKLWPHMTYGYGMHFWGRWIK